MVDPLFNVAFQDVPVYMNRKGLPETMGPVFGLTLDCGIPPPVEVENVRGVL
jgi:hypothetical protein